MARVAVVGVGAIGATVAAAVQDAGAHELVLCARRPLERVIVERPEGGEVELRGPVLPAPDGVAPAEWVLRAVKAHQTESAVGWLRALGRPPLDDLDEPLHALDLDLVRDQAVGEGRRLGPAPR